MGVQIRDQREGAKEMGVWYAGAVMGVRRDWAVEMGSREMQKWGTERWG